MKRRALRRKKVAERKKIVKQEEPTRGKEVYENVISYIKRQDNQALAINAVAENIIVVSLDYANRKVPEIIAGLAKFFRAGAKFLALQLLGGAAKRKNIIIPEVKKSLRKIVSSYDDTPEAEDVEREVYPWSQRILEGFSAERIKKRRFLSDEDNKNLFDIVCFAMYFAKKNKDVFERAMSIANPPFFRAMVSVADAFLKRGNKVSDAAYKAMIPAIPFLENETSRECLNGSLQEWKLRKQEERREEEEDKVRHESICRLFAQQTEHTNLTRRVYIKTDRARGVVVSPCCLLHALPIYHRESEPAKKEQKCCVM